MSRAGILLLLSVFSLMSLQPHVSPSAAHTSLSGGVFKLIVLLPLVIQVIITTGLGFPHAARVPQNEHFQPLRSSGPLNQRCSEQRFIYRSTAHVVKFVKS